MELLPSGDLKVDVSLTRTVPWYTRLATSARVVVAQMSRAEKIVCGVLAATLVLSAIVSIFYLFYRWTELLPENGGQYEEAAVGQPYSLNPILASGNDVDTDIIHLVYSSLFTLDKDLHLQPDLAESYELSADRRQYTIKLRPQVTWHDGQPFNADDVIFTISSIQTPDYNSPLASQFQGVTIEKVDDLTVRFTLKQPYTPFITSLTTKIIPRHVWEHIAPKNAALAEQNRKPVGTGPYAFAEMTTRRKTGEVTNIRLLRNDKYYRQLPYLNDITFTFFATHDEASNALAAHQVDGVGFLPLQLLDRFANKNSFTVHRLLIPQYFALFFNQEKNSLLRDAGVRNALVLATDREAIVNEALGGQGRPLHVPIPFGLLGHNADLTTSFDPAAAQQNLEEAGWKDVDGDGIREKNNQRLHFTITTTDWPEYVRTAEVIQQQWQKIGVETNIEHLGAGTIQQTIVRPREYEILLFGEILPADPDPYPFWHSTQAKNPGLNLTLLKDKTVDQLLETARQTGNNDERQEQYRQFQNKIIELNPAIILYQPYYLFVSTDNVRGVADGQAALPAQRFNTIADWHVKTKRIWKRN